MWLHLSLYVQILPINKVWTCMWSRRDRFDLLAVLCSLRWTSGLQPWNYDDWYGNGWWCFLVSRTLTQNIVTIPSLITGKFRSTDAQSFGHLARCSRVWKRTRTQWWSFLSRKIPSPDRPVLLQFRANLQPFWLLKWTWLYPSRCLCTPCPGLVDHFLR